MGFMWTLGMSEGSTKGEIPQRITRPGQRTNVYTLSDIVCAMAQSKVRGFSQLHCMMDLSSLFFVNVYQAGLS